MITIDPNGSLMVYGLSYMRKDGKRYRRVGRPWAHSVMVVAEERMVAPYRFMMVPTDRLRLVYRDWLDAPALIDGELSMVMADLLMDDLDEVLEHPLNRHRVKSFRRDAETLARWFAKRSRSPANNKVVLAENAPEPVRRQQH